MIGEYWPDAVLYEHLLGGQRVRRVQPSRDYPGFGFTLAGALRASLGIARRARRHVRVYRFKPGHRYRAVATVMTPGGRRSGSAVDF